MQIRKTGGNNKVIEISSHKLLKKEIGIHIETDRITKKSYPMHTHDFHELVIVTDGIGIHQCNNEIYEVCAGDVFVLKDGDEHGFKDLNNFTLFNIMYTKEQILQSDIEIRDIPGFHALFWLEPLYRKRHRFMSRLHLDSKELIYVSNIAHMLLREQEAKVVGYKSMMWVLFMHLIVYISRQYSNELNRNIKSMTLLANTITYIEENYMECLNLNFLANQAGLSVNQFLRVFKQCYDISPIEYINKLRISKACELLEKTDSTIMQISEQIGFGDSNYFTRYFKKMMGCAPSQYRKKLSIFSFNK